MEQLSYMSRELRKLLGGYKMWNSNFTASTLDISFTVKNCYVLFQFGNWHLPFDNFRRLNPAKSKLLLFLPKPTVDNPRAWKTSSQMEATFLRIADFYFGNRKGRLELSQGSQESNTLRGRNYHRYSGRVVLQETCDAENSPRFCSRF